MIKSFHTRSGTEIPLPIFFPDATRAVVKTLDSQDIAHTHTPGVLVNTLHLFHHPGPNTIKGLGGVAKFMGWDGGIISDSGGFQVMSIAKTQNPNHAVSDSGVTFKLGNKKILFTPELSIRIQHSLHTDLFVVLDDFTLPKASREVAQATVERTLKWAQRSKKEFDSIYKNSKVKPYLIGVVQGDEHLDLRQYCTKELVKIGFDGLGYGGWPVNENGFMYDIAKVIADNCPKDYLLYGLGVGKPDEIVGCYRLGWQIFDCVLPSRDARHGRLYVYNAPSIDEIDIRQPKFFSYFTPDKETYYRDPRPVSTACDCHLCTHYSRSYLYHLLKIGDATALRLSTIHNLRFYSILMEKLKELKIKF